MAASPLPVPPAPREEALRPQPTFTSQVPAQADPRQMAAQSTQIVTGKIREIHRNAEEIFRIAQSSMPWLLGDLQKMVEVLMSMEKQASEMMQRQQQPAGAQPPDQVGAPSPTDAAPMA